jgi:hypothetical protein
MSFENEYHGPHPEHVRHDYSLPDNQRCRFTGSRGHRCEYRIFDPATGLCVIHERRVTQKMEARARKLAERLFQKAGNLQTREQIRPFLTELMRLMVEGQIDRRDAAVLAYTCSLVLQTLPSGKVKPPKKEVEIIWDILSDPKTDPPAPASNQGSA